MKRGFTLLELIIVIIIIGILATLAFTQYTRVIEKSRSAEATIILGQLRTAEVAYYLEYGEYAPTTDPLIMQPPNNCVPTHYFRYSIDGNMGIATRCGIGEGKRPGSIDEYTVSIDFDTGDMVGL